MVITGRDGETLQRCEDEPSHAVVNAAIDVIRQHGAIVVDPANIPTAKQLVERILTGR